MGKLIDVRLTVGELTAIAEALLTLQAVYNTDGRDAAGIGGLRDKLLATIRGSGEPGAIPADDGPF